MFQVEFFARSLRFLAFFAVNCSNGFLTAKFAKNRKGPQKVSQIVIPRSLSFGLLIAKTQTKVLALNRW